MEDIKIVKLEGPDRVRMRPEVMFLSKGFSGIKFLVDSLFSIFLAEAQMGYCKHLTVLQQGDMLSICGNGRGICLGQEENDEQVWKRIFEPACDAGEPRFCDDPHGLLYGTESTSFFQLEPVDCFALYCAMCGCKVMDVVSVRKGVKGELHFEEGHNIGGLQISETDKKDVTCFRLELDPKVFDVTRIPRKVIQESLRDFALLTPGLTCVYENETDFQRMEFCYQNGISDLVKEKIADGTPMYRTTIQGRDKLRYSTDSYDACVELVIAPAIHQGKELCFHNYNNLFCGGTHYRVLQRKLCEIFNRCFMSHILGDKPMKLRKRLRLERKKSLTSWELQRHLIVALVSWSDQKEGCWNHRSKMSISSKTIEDMTSDACEELEDFVFDNKQQLLPIVDAILEARKPFWKKWFS